MPSFPGPDQVVTRFPVALVIGLAAGFVGAIPPGPINITVIRKSSQGDRLEAIRVALGGAIVDALICALVGLGFALGIGVGVFLWFLLLAKVVEKLRNHPAGEWIKHAATVAGVLLVGFGLFFAWKTLQGG